MVNTLTLDVTWESEESSDSHTKKLSPTLAWNDLVAKGKRAEIARDILEDLQQYNMYAKL